MQALNPPIKKPTLSSQGKGSTDSFEKKVSKVEIFYR